MIIKLHSSGKSFKGLVRYLAHDPKAETNERVAWTHTLNTASDDPSLAMHEIYWTYKAANELKREAGIRRGGQQLKSPVKHFSLSWEPGDDPSQEHMIATVESFLAHMRWSEHQAILFAHNDTAHRHVHVVLNAVHPETGRKLDERNDWERAKPWGLAYELAQGEVLCKQRLLRPNDRTPTPTRATWQRLKDYEGEDERYEQRRVSGNWDYIERKGPEDRQSREWEALREHQKQEREAFFASGKQVYREVSHKAYLKVREAFRPEWREYYAATRDGQANSDLSRMKADILSRQKAALDVEWQNGSHTKRAERDKEYAEILAHQRDDRRELRRAQELGRSYTVLDIISAPRHRRPDAPEHQNRPTRSPSPTRETWQPLRDSSPDEERRRGYFDGPTIHERSRQERAVLRGNQKAEREAFYSAGKGSVQVARQQARDQVKVEIRATFEAINQAKASGHNRTALAGLRFIRLRQSGETTKLRADVAALTAKDERKRQAKEMGVHHKAERLVLRKRNLDGLRSYRVMDRDRGLIGSEEAVRLAQSQDDARQKDWRQSRPQPPASMAGLETDAARFKARIHSTTERTTKAAEFEERVKLSWRRTRPVPGRGRD